MKILKGIDLRVYEAERVALIADKNSGREALIGLLTLNIKRDDSDEFLYDSNQFSPERTNIQSKTIDSNKPKPEKEKNQSYFEMMG